MITRFAVLKGFKSVIAGRDLAGLFKDGHVYEVNELMGQILIKDLGPHAIPKHYEGNKLSYIITSGVHCLTENEYKEQIKAQGGE